MYYLDNNDYQLFKSYTHLNLFECYLNQAEIAERQIRLALEPEVAALYCSELQEHMLTPAFQPGTNYMVLDMGG